MGFSEGLMKRVQKILIWVGIIAYMFVVLGLVDNKMDKIPCEVVSVIVKDSTKNHFIESHDIYSMVIFYDKNILGKPFNMINTEEIEDLLGKYPFVRNAQVFKGSNGKINISVTQREPVVRVLNYNDQGYYIDDEGFVMPVSEYYTARVLVVNGWNLGGINPGFNLEDYKGNSKYKTLQDVYLLSKFIHHDKFWKAQIEQIYVTRSGEFELIPRVGAHSIIFGDLNKFHEKFRKLYALYIYGLNNEGWNTYNRINLKYEGQVVCTKR